MLSILSQPSADNLPEISEITEIETEAEKPEFEIVLGRLQVASLLFVGTVVLVIFSAAAYLAGRASVPPTQPKQVVETPPAPKIPMLEATLTKAPPAPKKTEGPVFGEPIKGAIYLQMGAVDEGIAALLVEGLRYRGFHAFAAPGPNDKIFRVLIGPFPDAESFNIAREAIHAIGVFTFVRKYEP
jgi:cell division septation protein DedD